MEEKNMKLKPIVAAVMTGAVLVGTMAQPIPTFAADSVDLNSMTLADITAKAKEEGDVESVGMPDSWANWGLTWDTKLPIGTAFRTGQREKTENG